MTTIPPGHYAQKQLLSRSGLVRWSHSRRFRTARELVAPFAGRRLLDYGCGDGTFLALVRDLFPEALGVDAEPEQIADCARRFAGVAGVSFLSTDRLVDPAYHARFDIVVCMEVLEHCPDDIQETVLDQIASVTAARGVVVFSVPIEIGPPLLAKQCARALVAMRGLSEYATRERYKPGELMRMLFAGEHTVMPREEYVGIIDFAEAQRAQAGPPPPGLRRDLAEAQRAEAGRTTRFTGHKGFNWRRLQRSIAQRFDLERRLFSPLPPLGAWLNSQVWFVCRKPSKA